MKNIHSNPAPLRQKLIEYLTLNRKAERTVHCYVSFIHSLAKHYRRSPDLLGPEDLQHWLYHLIAERKQAPSTVNLAINAVRSFYGGLLQQDIEPLRRRIKRPRRPARAPRVYSLAEVEKLLTLGTRDNLRARAFLSCVYGGGLRLSEATHIRFHRNPHRIVDLDSARHRLLVSHPKGGRQRYTLLSENLLAVLRDYYRQARPKTFLFPGAEPLEPINKATGQNIFYGAVAKAGLPDRGGIHSLRHSFATHCLENGIEITIVQRLLGHASLHTAILHTWGQNLMNHPHLHCLVSGGGLTTQNIWAGPKQARWLFPVHAVGHLFRAKFCAGLLRLHATAKLQFHGALQPLRPTAAFAQMLRHLQAQRWVVFAKGSVVGPDHVLDYLGRYTHRVAISNGRLRALDLNARTVAFTYKDYAHGHRLKTLPLSATEFLRRFLLHVLPQGFTKTGTMGCWAITGANSGSPWPARLWRDPPCALNPKPPGCPPPPPPPQFSARTARARRFVASLASTPPVNGPSSLARLGTPASPCTWIAHEPPRPQAHRRLSQAARLVSRDGPTLLLSTSSHHHRYRP